MVLGVTQLISNNGAGKDADDGSERLALSKASYAGLEAARTAANPGVGAVAVKEKEVTLFGEQVPLPPFGGTTTL